MSLFDTHVMVDWSGGNDTGSTPRKDAIWAAIARDGITAEPVYLRNRLVAEDWLGDLIATELDAQRRVAIGFDFPFGYPRGFAKALTGQATALAVWDWLAARIKDTAEQNNRCEIADQINASLPGIGPFWGNPFRTREFADLPRKGLARTNRDFPERRQVETHAKGSFTCWQLAGAGAVGSQVLMGLPVLARLRERFDVAVWPFETLDRPVAFLEIWPSLIADIIAEQMQDGQIKDAVQVRCLVQSVATLDQSGKLATLLDAAPLEQEEGWILGVGHEQELAKAASSPLPNDCFALPPGVNWTPVDQALASLRDALRPVTGTKTLPVTQAGGHIIAEDVTARRANPPAANSAIDGYGFAYGHIAPSMPLVSGRAAAGAPYPNRVPKGHAIRILTGALLPQGVDTVVMQEECETEGSTVTFKAKIKQGQNTRKAGEDIEAGAQALPKGTRLRPQDLALFSALGVPDVTVHTPLRVGVLSTGDELATPDQTIGTDKTFDANRPMLLELCRSWGYHAIDLGLVPDHRDALRATLNTARHKCDVVLSSGGASGGDEDHVSALLSAEAHLTHWRIAIKPGRPLALALWQGMPIFGLPGNPVAAFVCSLIFARPALSLMAGSGWLEPQGFEIPAGFEKSKKQGRREYLRARIGAEGQAQIFHSEGSGRISGLSWADGLIELPDHAATIRPGDPVRYLPFASFGIM